MSLDDTTYGWDVSNYQAEMTFENFRQFSAEGGAFSIALATDGTGFQNFMFSKQLDWGRRAGMVTSAYHYVRDASISEQILNIKRTVPLDCPVIPDAEHGSGGIGVLDSLVQALLNEGYRVPLEYLPRWYWQTIGSPWLGGRRPLWASWYPDYVRRTKEAGRALLPDGVWGGYGGSQVLITQFTSSGAAGGYPGPLDLNAFRGTRSELSALLQGGNAMDWTDRRKNPDGWEEEMGDFIVNAEWRLSQLNKIPVYGQDRTTTIATEIGYLPENFRAVLAGQAAILAAVHGDDISEAIERAVKTHTPTAEQNAAALEATLLPEVARVMKQVIDDDDVDQAKHTAAELLRLIANAVPKPPEQEPTV